MIFKMNLNLWITFIGAGCVTWGVLNFTNGYNIFDENQLNFAKGIVQIITGFFIIVVRPKIPFLL